MIKYSLINDKLLWQLWNIGRYIEFSYLSPLSYYLAYKNKSDGSLFLIKIWL